MSREVEIAAEKDSLADVREMEGEGEEVSLRGEEEEELALELEEILKTCSRTDAKPKSFPGSASEPGKKT